MLIICNLTARCFVVVLYDYRHACLFVALNRRSHPSFHSQRRDNSEHVIGSYCVLRVPRTLHFLLENTQNLNYAYISVFITFVFYTILHTKNQISTNMVRWLFRTSVDKLIYLILLKLNVNYFSVTRLSAHCFAKN